MVIYVTWYNSNNDNFELRCNMKKSTIKTTCGINLEFDILPFLKNKQNDNCLLENLMVQLNIKSSDLKLIQELSSFNENQIIQEIKNNLDEFKKKFNTDISIRFELENKEFSNYFDYLLFKDDSIIVYEQNDKIDGLVKKIRTTLNKSYNSQSNGISVASGYIVPMVFNKEIQSKKNTTKILFEYLSELEEEFLYEEVFGEINSIDMLSKLLNLDNPLNHLILNNNYEFCEFQDYNIIDVTGNSIKTWNLSNYFIGTFADYEIEDNISNMNQIQNVINKIIQMNADEALDKFKIKDFQPIGAFVYIEDVIMGGSEYNVQLVWQGQINPIPTDTKTITDFILGKTLLDELA